MARLTLALLLPALAIAAAGCGKKEVTVVAPAPATERADPPADPPRGWRTHENPGAGFTIALPRSWSAEVRGSATRVRSGDDTVIVSLQADRSETARTTPAAQYALATFEALPGYRDLEGRSADAPDTPYETARVSGSGRLEESGRRQRVSVTVMRRPGRVSYPAVAFSDPRARAGRRTLDRALETFRAGPPD